MKSEKTKNMILCAMFIALIIVGAFIKIPVPVVPFTLQYLFTMLAGILLGGKRGAISVCIYILLGLIGLPVFAEGGGLGYILKPSFGYIIGFVVGTFITGTMVNKNKEIKYILLANFLGLISVYLIGIGYYYFISNFYLSIPIDIGTLILYGFILAVPGDIVLCIIGAIIGKRLISVKLLEKI